MKVSIFTIESEKGQKLKLIHYLNLYIFLFSFISECWIISTAKNMKRRRELLQEEATVGGDGDRDGGGDLDISSSSSIGGNDGSSSSTAATNLEALRESNILRNAAFLNSLGLSDDKSAIARQSLQIMNKATKSNANAKTLRKRAKNHGDEGDDDDNDDDVDNDDANANANEYGSLQAIRRSSRLQGTSAEIDFYNSLGDDGSKIGTSERKLKTEKLNVDFDFENNFEDDVDEDSEYTKRERITATSLRDFIDSMNAEYSGNISDEQISHCVYRIQTMSSKRLATRIKMIAR